MIEVRNLTKKYGLRTAIDDLDFTINSGEIVGFLGPNGAGKTTTMNIMTGFIAATSGDVTINGLDILAEPERAKANIGYLPDTPPVYGDMRVCEYLNFVADIKGVRKGRREMLENIMAQVSISDISRRLIKNLSRGYRQRVGLAQAMVGEPKVIIMDEPTIGLDPKQIIEMRDVVKRLGTRHTVIMSSHIMQEVSAVCDRVLIINSGKIVASGTPQGLSEGLQKGQMKVRVKGEREEILSALNEVALITNIGEEKTEEAGTLELLLSGNDGADIREAIFYCFAKNNLPILSMKSTELTLEEIFLSLTTANPGGEAEEAERGFIPRVAAGFGAEPHCKMSEANPGGEAEEAERGFNPREAAGFGAEPHCKISEANPGGEAEEAERGFNPRVAAGFGAEPHSKGGEADDSDI